MKPKIETIDGKTIVCLGDYNCVKWVKGKEKQALSILNAGCREAEEILRQLGYDAKSITELTSDVCGSDCPSINTRFCKDPEFMEYIRTWRPTYIPFSTYATMPDKYKQLIRELVSRGYVKEQTCCIQYNDKCECVKTDHGFFITARVIDYDKCIKWSRNECIMTVRQAITEVLSFMKPKTQQIKIT
jgi:hypothetical protein